MAALIRTKEPLNGPVYNQFQMSGWQVNSRSYSWSPPTDVFETDSDITIRIEIAGMKQSDISIGINENCLVVSGNRKEFGEKRAFHQMEIRFGEFSSTIELPKRVDLEKAEANYEDGFLTISIPRIQPTKIGIKG